MLGSICLKNRNRLLEPIHQVIKHLNRRFNTCHLFNETVNISTKTMRSAPERLIGKKCNCVQNDTAYCSRVFTGESDK